mmetsp:Transcript_2209/g.4572  ORF Transcript_2209/g.4572 Transcript_2209/m.4572 type:complete len:120 (-) Transcript_2209:122-481(-)
MWSTTYYGIADTMCEFCDLIPHEEGTESSIKRETFGFFSAAAIEEVVRQANNNNNNNNGRNDNGNALSFCCERCLCVCFCDDPVCLDRHASVRSGHKDLCKKIDLTKIVVEKECVQLLL